MQSRCMAAHENGSEKQLELGRGTFFYPIFSHYSLKHALDEHEGKVSIGGRTNTNLLFANDKTCTMFKLKKRLN